MSVLFYSSKNIKKNVSYAAQLTFNIDNKRNVSWAPNHHFRMISEGSCDHTEDWSNDAENSTLPSQDVTF